MKKFVCLFAVLAFTFAGLADAGPIRNLFHRLRPHSGGCASGQCSPSKACPECPGGECPVPEAVGAAAPRQLDGKAFDGALQNALTKFGGKKHKASERIILKIINAPDSPKRTRQLAVMEELTRAHLHLPAQGAIDWSQVDWSKILQGLIRVLIAILPLLLAA